MLPDIQSGSIEAVNENFPPADWTLSVSADGLWSLAPKHPQPRFDAYRTDSVLLTPIVRGPQQARRLELSIRTQALDASTDGRERTFNVSYAGAFALWGLLGGHAIKHLAAAVGTFAIASAPRVRQAQPGRRGCDL